MHMAINLVRMVTYHEELPPIKSDNPLSTWSCEIVRHTKTIICPAYGYESMATKLGRVLIYREGLLTIKSYNVLTAWSCKVT